MNLRKVFIWGAGSSGSKTYKNIKDKISIEGFIDSNIQKWDGYQDGLKIFPPKIINEFVLRPFIIISSTWGNEIEEELKTRGFKEVKDYIDCKNLSNFFDVCGFNYTSGENMEEESKPDINYKKCHVKGIILSIGENNPEYFIKLRNLFLSIEKFSGEISTFDRRVVFMGEPETKYRKELERLKVEITVNSPVKSEYPHNNKIRLLEQNLGYDWYIMLDHDIIVTRDFFSFLMGETIKAKPVDMAIISKDYWKKIYNLFGLEAPAKEYISTSTGEPTLPFFNSGVILVPGKLRELLYTTWLNYITGLIIKKEQIKEYIFYIDEIALALALQKASIPISQLPVEMNFHIHSAVNESFKPESIDPYIIHYHWLIDESGFIRPSHYPKVQKRITAFNEYLKCSRKKNFNNELFWDFRYSKYPDCGSGIGSRGEILELKRNILKRIIFDENPNSILDIGCGDQFVTSFIPDDKYLGIDLSTVVIKQNSEKYPNRNFIQGNFLEMDVSSCEMTICLDLLIHIDKYDDYRNFINHIVKKTKKIGIISGFEDVPQIYCSELTFFHEPLSKTLRDFGIDELQKIGTYRELTVWCFRKKQNDVIDLSKHINKYKSHNDISNDTLNVLRSQSINSSILDQLVKISRDNFGFFAKHTARAYEYVWLANQLNNVKGKNILDIGTGLNPLPIYFAKLGANVYTIDNSKMLRNWQQQNNDWNEWGYIDYGEKYPNIRSFNIDVSNVYFKNDFFDYIYSISVIEHFSAKYRKGIWERFRKWLKREGTLFLTIDLYKDSNDLWNYCYGELVEERDKHGNLYGMIKEASPDLDFYKVEVEKNIYQLDKLDIATLVGEIGSIKNSN